MYYTKRHIDYSSKVLNRERYSVLDNAYIKGGIGKLRHALAELNRVYKRGW